MELRRELAGLARSSQTEAFEARLQHLQPEFLLDKDLLVELVEYPKYFSLLMDHLEVKVSTANLRRLLKYVLSGGGIRRMPPRVASATQGPCPYALVRPYYQRGLVRPWHLLASVESSLLLEDLLRELEFVAGQHYCHKVMAKVLRRWRKKPPTAERLRLGWRYAAWTPAIEQQVLEIAFQHDLVEVVEDFMQRYPGLTFERLVPRDIWRNQTCRTVPIVLAAGRLLRQELEPLFREVLLAALGRPSLSMGPMQRALLLELAGVQGRLSMMMWLQAVAYSARDISSCLIETLHQGVTVLEFEEYVESVIASFLTEALLVSIGYMMPRHKSHPSYGGGLAQLVAYQPLTVVAPALGQLANPTGLWYWADTLVSAAVLYQRAETLAWLLERLPQSALEAEFLLEQSRKAAFLGYTRLVTILDDRLGSS